MLHCSLNSTIFFRKKFFNLEGESTLRIKGQKNKQSLWYQDGQKDWEGLGSVRTQ